MATATEIPPRRWSMGDVFHDLNNAETGLARSNGFLRVQNARLDNVWRGLPKVTENDLASIEQSDGSCPICLTPLLAIMAEEETALAMDSPAQPAEILGVTRLVDTCGHLFCRKDIRNWLYQGNLTCPTCRTPVLAPDSTSEQRARQEIEQEQEGQASQASGNNEVTQLLDALFSLPEPLAVLDHAILQDILQETQYEYDDDRSAFDMYS